MNPSSEGVNKHFVYTWELNVAVTGAPFQSAFAMLALAERVLCYLDCSTPREDNLVSRVLHFSRIYRFAKGC